MKKERESNDRHHAIDAVVAACATRSMQQKITNFVAHKQGDVFTGERVDFKTGEIISLVFPEPYPKFKDDVEIRVFSDNPKSELEKRLPDYPQYNHEFVKPLFVSRMTDRKVTGQGHLETFRSAKMIEQGISTLKTPLTQINLATLENMVNRDREKALYEALKARLEQFNNDPLKAFTEPFYKKGGEQVKSIKIKRTQKSGTLINQGKIVVDNGSMVRTDVFCKNGKYYLVPIYAWQVAKGILPTKAATSGKQEKDWEEMDESSTFLFSLNQNDLIRVETKKGAIFGYYQGMDRSSGSISIKVHDSDKTKGSNGLYDGVGIKTALSFEKYAVDVLGNVIKCKTQLNRQPFKR